MRVCLSYKDFGGLKITMSKDWLEWPKTGSYPE
jgi:hypothetical protein